jgi:hypothetical protein
MEPASAFPGTQQQLQIAGAFQEGEDWKTGGRRLEDTQMASSRRFAVVRTASGGGKEAGENNACLYRAEARKNSTDPEGDRKGWRGRRVRERFRVVSLLVSLTCKLC